MKNNKYKYQIVFIISTLIIMGVNSVVFANPQIANISYWYGDDDIRTVIYNVLDYEYG